jgi:acyl-coenzyme A synthetase/AMP-(fatty) acid ligase
VNGFQVAPAELEAVLLRHEDIADAAVVAIKLCVLFSFLPKEKWKKKKKNKTQHQILSRSQCKLYG